MKIKLLSLLLCVITIMSVALTGCGLNQEEDEDITADSTGVRPALTLTLHIPVQPGTTDEAIAAVEAAINEHTKTYKTAIQLNAIPQDQYKAAVDEYITNIENILIAEEEEEVRKKEEAKKLREQNITTEETTEETEPEVTEEETIRNELDMVELKYPEVAPKQMDIFLIQGYEAYNEYIEREALSILDDELNGTSKILSTFIYPAFLSSVKINGSTYAIPNNHMIGEYKYLLVNKRLVDEYHYDADSLSTLLKCEAFVDDMAVTEPGINPVMSNIDPVGMKYWSLDGSFSLLASSVANTASETIKTPPKNVFSIKAFTDTIGLMKRFEEKGYIANDPTGEEEFVIGVMSGDASLMEKYEENYYITIYEKPRATSEDIFSSMFAVSAYTKNLARAMEVITDLNTTPTLRTILQYGVEGVNYEIDKDTKLLVKLDNSYNVNLGDTGNVYMTYPGEGIPMSYWDYAKKQNQDSIVSPYLKFFDFVPAGSESMYQELATLSDEYWAKIEACPTADWDAFVTEMKAEVDVLPLIMKMLDIEVEAATPGYVYEDFHTTVYPPA
jgi:Uncharacterized protein conserved in bacteria